MKYLLVIIFSILVWGYSAAILNVPAAYSTIQSGIEAAADLDTVLVSEGTYYEDINFLGKEIKVFSRFTLDNNSAHITNTVISGSGTGSVVTIASNETQETVLKGFTICNGNNAAGAGISIRNSAPVIQYCVIHSNTSAIAAGVLAVNSQATLIKLTICNNNGRGLRIIGGMSTEVNSCVIYGNNGNISSSTTTTFSYCDLETPIDGVGNISTDPLLANPAMGDFTPQANSPCVNSGSPYLYPDADGTRPDIGALCYLNNAPSLFGDFSASETRVIATQDYEISFSSSVLAFNCTILGYLWDFGDGGTSTLAEPIHSFSPGGNYDISLTISTTNQPFEIIKPGYISILNDVTENFPSSFVAADSPYYIGTEHFIHQDITIAPGVEIYLGSGVSISIFGTVTALGTTAAPIMISGFYGDVYGGTIIFSGASSMEYCHFVRCYTVQFASQNQAITIAHCKFEHMLQNGLMLVNDATVTDCVVTNCTEFGIMVYEGAQISDCTVTNCRNYGIYLTDNYLYEVVFDNTLSNCTVNIDPNLFTNLYIGQGRNVNVNGCQILEGSRGIEIKGNGNRVMINDCVIRDGTYFGIAVRELAMVSICNNDISGFSNGIELCSPQVADIYSNYLHDNSYAISIEFRVMNAVKIQGNLICNNRSGGITMFDCTAMISHNTIVHNHPGVPDNCYGIVCSAVSRPFIVSNIIYDHGGDVMFEDGVPDLSPALSNNLLQYPLPAEVQDLGNNLLGDPMFLPNSWYHLSANSPAIDNGNMEPMYFSLLQNDIWGGVRIYDGDNNGNAIIDRGCNEYCPTPVADETIPSPGEFRLDIYPNPMRNKVNLQCTARDATTQYSIAIYNLRGQKLRVFSGEEMKGNMLLNWDGTDNEGRTVSAGIYIIHVKGKYLSLTRKMTLIK